MPASDEGDQGRNAPNSLVPLAASSPLEISFEPDSVGLSVVYAPRQHQADIVFVHGLGGTSRLTWCKDKNVNKFWPLKWLPSEPEICHTRISTFGYNAAFRKAGNIATSVFDFAKELLFYLKHAKDASCRDLGIGHVPLIFIVHSMGGLVVKEAYLQGQNDPEYESIVRAISAIIFLGTPHRGSELAQSLNRILQTTPTSSPKQYIADLARNSPMLQRLNELFRHVAPKIDIVSFYETQPTLIGLSRVMVVQRDSAVLGYPGEISKPLDADHHGVCKYDGRTDPNYLAVRNILHSLVQKARLKGGESGPFLSGALPWVLPIGKPSRDLRTTLAITELPDADYSFFRDQWLQGTCLWIFDETPYREWMRDLEPRPHVLWVNGAPGTGKSVLASFIINNLVQSGASCQYFFIRIEDDRKRTINMLLRCLAYQIAQAQAEFAEKVCQLAAETTQFAIAGTRTLWDRVFRSILFETSQTQPLFWIIDGIDEAESPKDLVRLFSDLSLSGLPIRLLLLSRKTPDLAQAFQQLGEYTLVQTINIDRRENPDLARYVQAELTPSLKAEVRQEVVQRMVDRAQESFLWTRFAVEEVNECHRSEDIERMLHKSPAGMEVLYEHMISKIVQLSSQQDRDLARAILQVAMYSMRSLSQPEFLQLLDGEFPDLLDIQRSVVDLTGGLVVIDNDGNIAMVHQMAREYFAGRVDTSRALFHVDPGTAHKQLFLGCMRCLMTIGLRGRITINRRPELLDYASTRWFSHLLLAPAEDEEVNLVLKEFLSGHWILAWIHYLATTEQFHILPQTSQNILTHGNRRNTSPEEPENESFQLSELELLRSWASDLVRIVGRFGTVLERHPEAIYKEIAPFCPPNSAMYRQFGKKEFRNLAVTGWPTDDWDDSVARLSLGKAMSHAVSAAGSHVGFLDPSGSVLLIDAPSLEGGLNRSIQHGERLYMFNFNSAGTLAVTYGFRTTKIWETSTGHCKQEVANPESRPRPLVMMFGNRNGPNTLLLGAEDKQLRLLDLSQAEAAWEHVASLDEPELEGHILNGASHMALSQDGVLAAVAYRGHPTSAWEVEGPVHLGHCWRNREAAVSGEVRQMLWHPTETIVVGLYIEGVVFAWNPYSGECREMAIGAARLTLNLDGSLFATGDARGIIKVFITASFGQLYHVSSQDTVFDLAFSPSGQRIYDVRGDYGNVWDPEVLFRLTSANEAAVNAELEESVLNQAASPKQYRRVESVTALASSPTGRFYCYGTERGTLKLVGARTGARTTLHATNSFIEIEFIVWSHDGHTLCFSDLGRRISVTTVQNLGDRFSDSSEALQTTTISLNTAAKGPVLGIMIHPTDPNQLFVHCAASLLIVSVSSALVISSIDRSTANHKWIPHPRQPTLLLGFGPRSVVLLDWALKELRTLLYGAAGQGQEANAPAPTQETPEGEVVEQVLVTQDNSHVLVQKAQRNHQAEAQWLLSFDIEPLSETASGVTPETIIPDPDRPVHRILAFLPRRRLVFLSNDFSICIMPLRPSPATELFALPRDWIAGTSLGLCHAWPAEKTLLCPRNGDVLAVKAAALA